MNAGFKSRNLFRALFGGLVFFMTAKRTARAGTDVGRLFNEDVKFRSSVGHEQEAGKHKSGNHVLLLG